MGKLAIDGGKPVREQKLRSGFHGSELIDEKEQEAVLNVLCKKRLFRFLGTKEQPSEAESLEQWYCQRLGTKYALAVNGGTSALIAALYGIDAGPGDEVIIPAYTYIATAAAVIAAGAVPVLAEIDESLNIDPADIERKITPHTKAVIPVHMRGVPAQIDRVTTIAQAHGLSVVEDVAQSNGGTFAGQALGTFGDVGCYSFQQYKIITAGEGGLVVTDNDRFYLRARMQHDCAMRFWKDAKGQEEHPDLVSGENYRISELAAALVLAQCDRLDPLLEHFRSIKSRIIAGISNIDGIELQHVPDPRGDCGISLCMLLPDAEISRRFAAALNAEGIGCGTIFDNSIPDRHIYRNWPFMMSGLADERRAPWKNPFYKGDIQGYSPTECPRTLELLGRTVMMLMDQTYSEQDADQAIEAVNKVATALL